MWLILGIPYVQHQNIMLPRQVFSALNLSFTHLEFHRKASVHYSYDKLNNGTYQVILLSHFKCALCL